MPVFVKLESLQKTEGTLKQRLAKSESRATALEKSLGEKDKQAEEVNRKMQDIENEADTNMMEKFELVTRIQDMKKEAEDQRHQITELVSINEELLGFAQAKEDQLAFLNKEVTQLQLLIQEKTEDSFKLKHELAGTRKQVNDLIEGEGALKLQYNSIRSKLSDTEHQLAQREEALDRLTKHLAGTIEGQDTILEEAENLHFSLRNANCKEKKLMDQLQHSQMIIDELEGKNAYMEADVSKARSEMAEMKKQNSLMLKSAEGKGLEAITMKKEAEEMRCTVQRLEDDIMEKEGQIAVLRSSFPKEFESTY